MTGARTGELARLLAAPLFAGIDDEAKALLRFEAGLALGSIMAPPETAPRPAYVRFTASSPGDALVQQGELTTELVVVLEGAVEATCVRPAGARVLHRVYGVNDWFGEASALSHCPSLVTCLATGPTRYAALDDRLFRKLYEDEVFRHRIDERYQRDMLGLHLRSSPLLRDLDEAEIGALQKHARLLTLDTGKPLAREGDRAGAFYLVRAGAICCTTARGGAKRTLAFYKGNSSFGEHSVLAEASTWPGSYSALMRTELVELPRAAFEDLGAATRRTMTQAANRIVTADDPNAEQIYSGLPLLGGSGVTALDEIHVMVAGQSVKGGDALVIDQQKCIRCNLCVESCVAVHEDGIPRISKVGTKVRTDEVLISACYHCEVPECMLSCDYGAIRRDPQGRIRFEYDNCVGCSSCIDGCPYGVIRLVEPRQRRDEPLPWWEQIPLLGSVVRLCRGAGGATDAAAVAAPPDESAVAAKPPPRPTKALNVGGSTNPVTGKTIKCDLCAGLPFEACVYNCPTFAIERRKPERLFLRNQRG